MAVSINELIARREEIKARKAELYDIETSVGEIVCKVPSAALVAESWDMSSAEGNKNLVYQCCVEPNLKDKDLQSAFKCAEPFDVVDEIFLPGEVSKIAGQLLKIAGFTGNVTSKLHDKVKN